MNCFMLRYAGILCTAILIFGNLKIFADTATTTQEGDGNKQYEACLLSTIKQSPFLSALEITKACERRKKNSANDGSRHYLPSPYDKRHDQERTTLHAHYVLTPHRPNYVLPMSYNFNKNRNFERIEDVDNDVVLDHMEMQFQVSMKYPVWDTILRSEWSLFSAYTARSFWQAYNEERSSPFRDTNHEPEFWLERPVDVDFGKFRAQWLRLGFVHQSNGRSSSFSRSWNRIYAHTAFDVGKTFIGVKVWSRIPEDEKESPDDPKGDDNPDITHFLGHLEVLNAFKHGKHSFSLQFRNNLKKDNKGAVELSWSFPTGGKVEAYVKYFNGYGESLLDYNRSSNRLSVGFIIANWL